MFQNRAGLLSLDLTAVRKTFAIFVIVLAVKLLLQHWLIHPSYDLHRDEYLHLDQGRHLAWGFISVPPVTSWISWLINLLGASVFWVKFFPALFGTLTIVIVARITETLGGKTFALVLASTAALLSALLRIDILYQPNPFDIFFWTLTYYTIIKYVSTNNPNWLYATGAALGFGMLSKYNIAFLVISLIPALLLTRPRIFAEKKLYIAALIALLIIAPNIWWQFNNHFPTLHQLNELSETQLVNVERNGFIKDQLLFFVNSSFIVLLAFIGLLFYQPFKTYRFILISYSLAIALYLFFKAKSYYAIGLYPVLLAFGSVYLEIILSRRQLKILRPVALALVILLFIPVLMLAFPMQSPGAIARNNERYRKLGLLRWEDGKDHTLPQDFADMRGWSAMAHKVDSIYSTITDKAHSLVLCDNYGQAGALNYYSRYKNINAVSLNADYINWIPLNRRYKNVILVKDPGDSDPGRTKEKPFFDIVTLAGKNEDPFSRESGTCIYLLKGARIDIGPVLQKEIDGIKKEK